MTDYIGKYSKKFESGSYGSLALGSCGYDWGLSCGSWQLTLRWGNCITFLKKYFPSDSSSLFFNSSMKDYASKTWPGVLYCSSPDAVKSVWQKCYNKVGADRFFEYEHAYMESNYYTPIKSKIKSILDLDSADRAFKECFWSWSIGRGPGGAYNEFKEVLSSLNITSLDYVDKELLFDAIYDKRYQTTKLSPYKKGPTDGSSERELLRPLLTSGTFSGRTEPTIEKQKPEKEPEKNISKEYPVTELHGTLKVIIRNDTLNVRSSPEFTDNIIYTYSYGQTAKVIGITKDEKFYQLEDGNFISSGTSYVQFIEDVKSSGFLVRIKAVGLEIKNAADILSTTVGKINQNAVYTIVEEKNGYGKLKSGAGWIPLNNSSVTRLS